MFIIVLSLVLIGTPAVLSSTALAQTRVDISQLVLAQPQTPLPSMLPSSYYPAPASTTPPATAPVTEQMHTPAQKPAHKALSGPVVPVRLIVPSAGIDSSIVGVGTKANGEMDVPSGKSNNVGWYKRGPAPGQAGSAVLDAHVFAAFSRLKYVKPGDSIYIEMSDGTQRHFVVSAAKTFALAGLSPSQLFRPTNAADLNLITCAGSLTADHSTYDHRLIVYSTLAGQ